MPPEDYLFSGTISDNIIMSENVPRADAMKASAHDANIAELVESLADGFDAQIGEGGSTLSSGQAQRIAIARTIYKKAGIVVFGEPTANLDVASIEKLQSVIKHLAKDRICIVVTHDDFTITVCDKVYTIEDGSVKEKLYGKA